MPIVWPPSRNLGLPGEVNGSLIWLVIFTGKPAIRNCQTQIYPSLWKRRNGTLRCVWYCSKLRQEGLNHLGIHMCGIRRVLEKVP